MPPRTVRAGSPKRKLSGAAAASAARKALALKGKSLPVATGIRPAPSDDGPRAGSGDEGGEGDDGGSIGSAVPSPAPKSVAGRRAAQAKDAAGGAAAGPAVPPQAPAKRIRKKSRYPKLKESVFGGKRDQAVSSILQGKVKPTESKAAKFARERRIVEKWDPKNVHVMDELQQKRDALKEANEDLDEATTVARNATKKAEALMDGIDEATLRKIPDDKKKWPEVRKKVRQVSDRIRDNFGMISNMLINRDLRDKPWTEEDVSVLGKMGLLFKAEREDYMELTTAAEAHVHEYITEWTDDTSVDCGVRMQKTEMAFKLKNWVVMGPLYDFKAIVHHRAMAYKQKMDDDEDEATKHFFDTIDDPMIHYMLSDEEKEFVAKMTKSFKQWLNDEAREALKEIKENFKKIRRQEKVPVSDGEESDDEDKK
jgi:hypothetical protein